MILIALTTSTAIASSAKDELPMPERIQFDSSIPPETRDQLLHTAKQYFAFWNTGIESYAKTALAADFKDLNLPEGRPQGPKGPLEASAAFRKAVPDLSLTVKSVYVLENKVIGQLHFEGHFSGTFGELKGSGQPISFSAVDMYTIENGKITENWHLEDNLTLMQQLGAISN
jgi:predicted ester cyclase